MGRRMRRRAPPGAPGRPRAPPGAARPGPPRYASNPPPNLLAAGQHLGLPWGAAGAMDKLEQRNC